MNGLKRRITCAILLLFHFHLLGCSSQHSQPIRVDVSPATGEVSLWVHDLELGDELRWTLRDGSVGEGELIGMEGGMLLIHHPVKAGRLHVASEESVPLADIMLLEKWKPGAERWVSIGMAATLLVGLTLYLGIAILVSGISYPSN